MKELYPILIVEDEPAHRLMIRKAIEDNGIPNPVAETIDGREGLDYVFGRGKYAERANKPEPCLILLDIKMPGIDGFEMLAALKSNQNTRQIPVVMLTTSATDADVQRSYRLGANAYLVKPVSHQQLWQKLRALKLFWLGAARLPVATQEED